MGYLGSVRLSEVEAVQQKIVDIVRHLEDSGEVSGQPATRKNATSIKHSLASQAAAAGVVVRGQIALFDEVETGRSGRAGHRQKNLRNRQSPRRGLTIPSGGRRSVSAVLRNRCVRVGGFRARPARLTIDVRAVDCIPKARCLASSSTGRLFLCVAGDWRSMRDRKEVSLNEPFVDQTGSLPANRARDLVVGDRLLHHAAVLCTWSPDLQHYLGTATRIEYPDVATESSADTVNCHPPLTLGNHDYGQYWDLELEECVSIALQNAKFFVTTSGTSELRQNVAAQFTSGTADQFGSIYDVAIQQSRTQSIPLTIDGAGNRTLPRGVFRANQIGGVEDALAEFDAQTSGFVNWANTDRTATPGLTTRSIRNSSRLMTSHNSRPSVNAWRPVASPRCVSKSFMAATT